VWTVTLKVGERICKEKAVSGLNGIIIKIIIIIIIIIIVIIIIIISFLCLYIVILSKLSRTYLFTYSM